MSNQAIQSLTRECSAKLSKAQAQNAKEKVCSLLCLLLMPYLNCWDFQEDIKRRHSLTLKYAVGLIMMHKKTNVKGLQMDRLVVIYAWYCKPRQPVIYNVLFHNGNICDVKEGWIFIILNSFRVVFEIVFAHVFKVNWNSILLLLLSNIKKLANILKVLTVAGTSRTPRWKLNIQKTIRLLYLCFRVGTKVK